MISELWGSGLPGRDLSLILLLFVPLLILLLLFH